MFQQKTLETLGNLPVQILLALIIGAMVYGNWLNDRYALEQQKEALQEQVKLEKRRVAAVERSALADEREAAALEELSNSDKRVYESLQKSEKERIVVLREFEQTLREIAKGCR